MNNDVNSFEAMSKYAVMNSASDYKTNTQAP